MEKAFTHNAINYAARTRDTGELVEIGIFTGDKRRPYHLQIEAETLGDLSGQTETDNNSTIQKLVDLAIADFCRAIDEGILKV
ncbi:MAG: hypothetical protein JKY96_02600 [Phycisphaerales bacterium]|nr:hypothetical protein [Phycisphaerales bacterium]